MLGKDTALILEGGAMRGVFTAGILSYFLEQNIQFPYVVACSAGASNAVNFLSKDTSRLKKSFVDIADHKEFAGFRYLLNGKGFFNTQFLYADVFRSVLPFDWETFSQNPAILKIGAVDMRTAAMKFWDKQEIKNTRDLGLKVRASSTIPIMMPLTKINNRVYMDGGTIQSIPIQRAMLDGYRKFVIIATQPHGYRKEKERTMGVTRRALRDYPCALEAIEKRYIRYNHTLDLIAELENTGKAYVLRPEMATIHRMERDVKKLNDAFRDAYRFIKEQSDIFLSFLEQDSSR